MARPYSKEYEHITSIKKYFRYDPKDGSMTFTGDTLVAYTPRKFETYGLQSITNIVETIGIFDIIIDDKYHANMYMLAKIAMEPSDIQTLVFENTPYLMLTFKTGDRFIINTNVIRNKGIVYAIYIELLDKGRIPFNFEYSDLFRLFDQSKELCDMNLPIDHAVLEFIVAHLARSSTDRSIPYRYTDMREPFTFTAIKDIANATVGSVPKVVGSYFSIGVNAALLNESEELQPFEKILRGIPITADE